MTADYFSQFKTVEAVKAEYRRLAMIHHPDRGGSTEVMQEINAQYKRALAACDGQKTEDEHGKEHTYHYQENVEQSVMDALFKILAIKMVAEIHLIGCWIWIEGETRPVKQELKEIGCLWHPKRGMWYWRSQEQARWKHRYSGGSLGYLAAKYGAKSFRTEDREEGERTPVQRRRGGAR